MIMDTQLASLLTAGALIVIGLFGTIYLDNLIKKVIALAFIGDGANLFLIAMGYKAGGIIYIFLPGMASNLVFTECIIPTAIRTGSHEYQTSVQVPWRLCWE